MALTFEQCIQVHDNLYEFIDKETNNKFVPEENKVDDLQYKIKILWDMGMTWNQTGNATTLKDAVLNCLSRSNNVDVNNFAIDGPSCCFKTTTINETLKLFENNNRYFKINNFFKDGLKSYNYAVPTAIEYQEKHVECFNKNATGLLFDRSIVSNIIFQFVYALINKPMNGYTYYGMCEEYYNLYNMKETFNRLKKYTARWQIPIFLIRSTSLGKAMRQRSFKEQTVSDGLKCKSKSYVDLMCAATVFVALKLNASLIDFDLLEMKYKSEYSVDNVIKIIANYIFNKLKIVNVYKPELCHSNFFVLEDKPDMYILSSRLCKK